MTGQTEAPCACDMTIEQIKSGNAASMRRAAILERTATGWRVHDWLEDSVAPTMDYTTVQAAIEAIETLAVKHAREPVREPCDDGGHVVRDDASITAALTS